jgi:ribonuclease G
VLRRIERALHRVADEGNERALILRVHPEVALYVLEQEPQLLRRLGKERGLQLTLRDDPLVRQDEFRMLAVGTRRDMTEQFAAA